MENNDQKNISAPVNKYILYFGRLSEEKGVDILIKAYAALNTDLKLYILGSGPMEKSLKI